MCGGKFCGGRIKKMNKSYIISYLLVNMFWVYLIKRYIRLLFPELCIGKGAAFIVYAGFFILNSGINLIYHEPVLNLLTSIIGMFCISMMYNSALRRKIVAVFLVYAICMVCDIIVATGIGKYVAGDQIGVINNIISYLLIFIVQLLLGQFGFASLKKEYHISGKQVLALIGVPVGSIIIVCTLVLSDIQRPRIVVLTSIVLLYVNLIVFYLYDSAIKNYEERYKNIELENQVAIYRNQLLVIQQSNDRIENLRHDIKHHAYALETMINKKLWQEAMKYINEIIEVTRAPKEQVQSGNEVLDSILNYLAQNAIKKNLDLQLDVKILQEIEFSFFDLNIVLGNLFDNAANAAENSDQKFINLKVEAEKDILYIKVVNSYKGVIWENNGKFKTTKVKADYHGRGLNNVRAVVNKYNGLLDIDYSKDIFRAQVLMYLV